MAATEPSQHSLDDLAFWRTSLPGVEHAILPPSSDRPNPRLGLGMLFASVFAPGATYALDAATGEIYWRRELPYFGDCSIELAGNLLFEKTAQALYALDPASGNIRWEFSPYGAEGETLYSAPTLDERRLFIGDRLGWLYCLDFDTGETIWKRLTSDDGRNDVNATAIVVAGLVITATNAGLALAYTVEDGRPVWQSKLDGPCTHHLFLAGKQVVAAAKSLHFLDPPTGKLQHCLGRPGLEVGFATATPSQVALFWIELGKYNEAEVKQRESETLFMFEGVHLLREIRCSPYASAVRFSHATGLLYASGLSGLDILNPDTGEWLHTLRSAEMTGGYGLPDVAENRIYSMDAKGVVYAVQHPGVSP